MLVVKTIQFCLQSLVRLLFLTTNMAAMTSRAIKQWANQCKFFWMRFNPTQQIISYIFNGFDHNCEDHSSFDFISAVHIWFISYASFTYIWTQNWPAPNVSGFIAQLVERRTGIARSRVQAPLKSWIFFRLLYAIVKIAIITARIILHLICFQLSYSKSGQACCFRCGRVTLIGKPRNFLHT